MSAATADRDAKRQLSDLVPIPAKNSESLYRGTLGMIATSTGLLQNGADTASMQFAGVIAEAGTGDGSTDFEVYTEGIFEFAYSPGDADDADTGTVVYISDNQTVDLVGNTSNDVMCGIIAYVVDTSTVKVKIDGYGFGGTN